VKRSLPDEIILGLLKARPSHGYDLLEVFRSKSYLGQSWTMSTSQLYAVLKRLNREALITGTEIDSPNAPSRVEYAITPHGEAKLLAWLYEPNPSSSIFRIRLLFLSRIFIANLLELPCEEIVSAQIMACEAQKAIFLTRLTSCDSDFVRLTINFVINQLDAATNWLNASNFDVAIN
jgi:DNA-binding PadR family transcriptional regulator